MQGKKEKNKNSFFLWKKKILCVPEARTRGRFTQNLKKRIELSSAQLMRHKSCEVKDELFNMQRLRDLGTKHKRTESITSDRWESMYRLKAERKVSRTWFMIKKKKGFIYPPVSYYIVKIVHNIKNKERYKRDAKWPNDSEEWVKGSENL